MTKPKDKWINPDGAYPRYFMHDAWHMRQGYYCSWCNAFLGEHVMYTQCHECDSVFTKEAAIRAYEERLAHYIQVNK